MSAETKIALAIDSNDMQQDLQARAIWAGGIDVAARAAANEAPEESGAFSYVEPVYADRLRVSTGEQLPDVEPVYAERLRASTGDQLPDVDWMLRQHELWRNLDSHLGTLATNTIASYITGCLVLEGAWRDDKGYLYERNPHLYGVEKDSRFGTRGHKLSYTVLKRETDPSFVLAARVPLDHKCRFTGCNNPYHVEEVTPQENNRRQRAAIKLENSLILGQLMLGPTGFDWIDELVSRANTEDTGVVVNTKEGPHRVIKMDDDPVIIRGEPIEDDMMAALRPPSKRKAPRPSRAKKPVVLDGQTSFFKPDKFVKADVKTVKAVGGVLLSRAVSPNNLFLY